jgi:uncharacterized membrane protein HdeD (DUF308 family)
MNNLTQNWWMVVLRGLLAVLFGLTAFIWPGLTWLTLVFLFGIYAVVDGVIAVATGLRHTKDSSRWWIFLIEGLVSIAAGVLAFLQPGLTSFVLVAVIAAWAIITGILEIAAAIRLRREITNEWALGLGGLLSIALGVFLFLQPLAGGLAIIWTIGAYAVLFGVLLISLGFRLRSAQLPVKTNSTSKKSLRQSPSTRS